MTIFDEAPATAAFRAEARAWLEANQLDHDDVGRLSTEEYPARRAWQRRLHAGGWAGVHWPVTYGGRGASTLEHIAFVEECARLQVPQPLNLIGLNIVGPTIVDLGTLEQKARYLPPLLAAEEVWCQGFSEPGVGSDLGSLRTRAVEDDHGWVVHGQKVWTSYAEVADRCLLLARTDPTAGSRTAITALLVDMHAPGVEVRGIRHATGEAEFNEVFLDGVHVPREDVLGDVGGGWTVAITTLMHERRNLGLAFHGETRVVLDRLLAALDAPGPRGRPLDRVDVQREAGRLVAEVEAFRATVLRVLTDPGHDGRPGPEGALLKLHWSGLNQRMTAFAWDVLGPQALADGAPGQPTPGRWAFEMLRSRGNTIEAGTTEILRNLLAERVLGLPRSR